MHRPMVVQQSEDLKNKSSLTTSRLRRSTNLEEEEETNKHIITFWVTINYKDIIGRALTIKTFVMQSTRHPATIALSIKHPPSSSASTTTLADDV
ncbi:hypothetical protein MOSE0_M01288 [Monosporozyma servazzii]